jgi:hypothetical protein
MDEYMEMLRFEEEISEESSSLCEEDFNSEDAVWEALSGGDGPSEIEILGMNLLLQDEDEVPTDDGGNDNSEMSGVLFTQRTVDSLELTRERLPHLVDRKRAPRRRKARKFYPTTHPGGEVDSLVLARERMPELVHINETLMTFYEEGRGLMGEVDSLELDKKRLPHLIHKRTTSKTQERRRRPRVSGEIYDEPLYDIKCAKLPGASDDSSTSSTESESSSDSLFTNDTVDSLILTRKRLASHKKLQPLKEFSNSKAIPLQTKSTPDLGRRLPSNPGVGLHRGLIRTSSSAGAA